MGTVRPHQNWRGLFFRGTWGTSSVPDTPPVGSAANCVTVTVNDCLAINWPGERTTAWHESRGESALWMGGLVDWMRDPTGQIYMRNRYYNPQTGQFTQMDPIGIAGGLNAYGFAAGDPVSFGDPYGLKVCLARGTTEPQRDWFQQGLQDATNTTFQWDSSGCVDESSVRSRGGGRRWEALQAIFMGQVRGDEVYTLAFREPTFWAWGTHYDPETRTVNISPDDPGNLRYIANRGICNPFSNESVVASPAAYMAHELLGHGTDGWLRRTLPYAFGFREGNALRVQNMYHRASGQPRRCGSSTSR